MQAITALNADNAGTLGSALRRLGLGARSMEEVADRVARHLYDGLGREGFQDTVLVRIYKTHPLGALPPDLQAFAKDVAGTELTARTRCLTLLGTAGDEAAWNDRHASRNHRAIPLPSESAVLQAPMIAQLVRQLGLEIANVVAPDPTLVIDAAKRRFNVFHVPRATGSPYIPAQDFVQQHNVASVLGFGGLLPPSDLFAVILFTRTPLPEADADAFRPLAMNVRLALLPFAGGRVFHDA